VIFLRKYSLLTWIIIILLAIGLIRQFVFSPSSILIPLLVFGVIFYFLKHPEKLQRNNRYGRTRRNHQGNGRKRRNQSFTVIKGKFEDSDEDKHYH